VFEPCGEIREYVGGYSDWERRRRQLAELENPNTRSDRNDQGAGKARGRRATKLSYQQQRELDELPGRIEHLEAETKKLQRRIAAPEFYAQGHEQVQPVLDEFDSLTDELEHSIDRWSELEELRENLQKRPT
jgi:ATP-binding cassette subfamily F protein uup